MVVTGASGGIGEACVTAFQELGAEVIGVDLTPTSTADHHLQQDLGHPDCGETLLGFLGSRAVDVLVNNAAQAHDKDAVRTTPAQFDRIMNVNLRAPWQLSTSLCPSLRARKGAIVNIASVHALATSAGVSAYAASKGALVALTRALAVEWAPEVRVNAVLPGAVDTEMLRSGLARSRLTLEELQSRQPLNRIGQPEDVASSVVHAATNPFMSGSVLVVDGGATARLSTEQ